MKEKENAANSTLTTTTTFSSNGTTFTLRRLCFSLSFFDIHTTSLVARWHESFLFLNALLLPFSDCDQEAITQVPNLFLVITKNHKSHLVQNISGLVPGVGMLCLLLLSAVYTRWSWLFSICSLLFVSALLYESLFFWPSTQVSGSR